MIALDKNRAKTERYVADYEKIEGEIAAHEPIWLHQIRKEAISRFQELGFPTIKEEEWRHTNVTPIVKREFTLAGAAAIDSLPDTIHHVTFPDSDFTQLVFVNGFFSPRLSHLNSLQDGIRVESLAQAIACDANALEPYLSRLGSYEEHPFAALNTALFRDGAYVHIKKGVVARTPIHLLFISTSPKQAVVSYPRTLVVAGAESQATIIESYAGVEGEVYFTNAVTEIAVGENAVIEHYKLQRESAQAFHIANMLFYLDRSSNFASHSISLGGSLVRNNVNAALNDEGIECTLNGLVMAAGKQHIDNHTYIDHARPHCASHELYKNIVDDHATGVFKGKILVRRDSQKTDAKQTNMTLLLSDEASIDSMPQLEIYADDVKCTHGATTGRLDENALFYLRTRGIGKPAAKNLLTYAFANEIINRIRIDAVREQLEQILRERLPFEQND
ncbi:MAG: Fe-S cluster assembly protein SufD [Candidatus Omnitrophota bacterium]|jgi:Fe-S cluster assembly protein SufD|nr:MAG: Fe-S cluster assembly protein SufD [Candidatus Omnitrophota bacterium]